METLAFSWLVMTMFIILIFTVWLTKGFTTHKYVIHPGKVWAVATVLILWLFIPFVMRAGFNEERAAETALEAAVLVISETDSIFTIPGQEDDYIIINVNDHAIDTLTPQARTSRLRYSNNLYDTPLIITVERQFKVTDYPMVD